MFFAQNYCDWITTDIGKISIVGKCVKCKKEKTVVVLVSELAAYGRGELIQNAMPNLSDDDREFLISGFCPECWDREFLISGFCPECWNSLFPGTGVVEGEE